MAEPSTPSRAPAAEEAELARVEAERNRLREDNLRLRDQLIGRDAELGQARGRTAAAENSTHTAAVIAGKLQSWIPGSMRFFGALVRRLQGRS